MNSKLFQFKVISAKYCSSYSIGKVTHFLQRLSTLTEGLHLLVLPFKLYFYLVWITLDVYFYLNIDISFDIFLMHYFETNSSDFVKTIYSLGM